ncbi:MAG: helix-turn-helix domain-containing protein [Sarcina sp.]
MKSYEAVSKRILELCSTKKISINALANLSGIRQSTLSSIITGKSKNPSLETIRKISFGLHINICDFFNSPLFSHSNLDDFE